MTVPLGPRGLSALLCLLCASALGGVWYVRSAARPEPAKLLRRLPPDVETVIAIDVAALRQAGILSAISGPEGVEEPDYRQFVDFTGFDYRTDLDYLIAGFDATGGYFLATGQFDWPALMQYAVLQGGACQHGFCRLPSETPNRRVSFFAERHSVLALAAGPEEWRASMLYQERGWPRRVPPQASLWAYLGQRFLSAPVNAGSARALLMGLLNGAQEVWISAQVQQLALEVRLEAICATPALAVAMRDRFQAAAAEIHQQTGREGASRQLLAVLAAGQFTANETTVTGVWRLEPGLLELLSGGLH